MHVTFLMSVSLYLQDYWVHDFKDITNTVYTCYRFCTIYVHALLSKNILSKMSVKSGSTDGTASLDKR